MVHTALVDLIGRVLNGRYRLLAPIGAGASARVYLADDVRLRRRVAVKVLHDALGDDGGFQRRFRAEAQMAAALHHPHVMAVYDWGEDDGIAFMVVELLKGGSLREPARRGRSPHARAGRARRAARSRPRSRTRTGAASCTATSSRRTCSSTRTGSCASPTSGSPVRWPRRRWTEPAGSARRHRRATRHRSRPAGRSTVAPTCTRSRVVLVEACTGEVPVVGDTAIGTLAARAHRPIAATGGARPARAGGHAAPASPIPPSATRTRGRWVPRSRRRLACCPRPEPLDLPGLDARGSRTSIARSTRRTPRFFDQDSPTALTRRRRPSRSSAPCPRRSARPARGCARRGAGRRRHRDRRRARRRCRGPRRRQRGWWPDGGRSRARRDDGDRGRQASPRMRAS